MGGQRGRRKGSTRCVLYCQQWPVHSTGARSTFLTSKYLAHTKQVQALVNRLAYTQTATPQLHFPPTSTYIRTYIRNLRIPTHSPSLPYSLLLLLFPPIPGSTSLYRFLPMLIGSRATDIGPASDFAFIRSRCIHNTKHGHA